MHTKRIIPCLDVKAGRVVKGTNFVGLQDAGDPVLMGHAMKCAIEAGRAAFRAGRIPRRRYASASSPVDGMIA